MPRRSRQNCAASTSHRSWPTGSPTASEAPSLRASSSNSFPEAVDAAENSGVRSYLAQQVVGRLQALDLAPLAVGTFRSFVRAGRHRSLLDDLLAAIHKSINEPKMLAAIREKIRDELPTILRFYRADAYVMKKVAASATAFFEDVRTDPEHPFRGEFDRLILSFVEKLETEPHYASRIDEFKRELLARPEIGRLVQSLWSGVRDIVAKNASGESDVLQRHLGSAFVEIGRQLAADADMRAEINQGMVVVLKGFIAEQKSGVSVFIADQVKAWDMRQLIELIETQHRQGPAVHPLQRDFDRRPCRPHAARHRSPHPRRCDPATQVTNRSGAASCNVHPEFQALQMVRTVPGVPYSILGKNQGEGQFV